MPQTEFLFANFTRGELSPRLMGRTDLAGYFNGCETCHNMLIHPLGGAYRRSGTRFIGEVKDSTKRTRLIPFQFSTTDSYILEFGEGYIRFYTERAQVLDGSTEAIEDVDKSNPAVVHITGHGFLVGDEIRITGVGGMTELNGNEYRVANPTADEFELNNPDGTPVNSLGYGTYTTGGDVEHIVLQVASPYTEAQLEQIRFTQSADVLYLVHPDHPPKELRRLSATNWQLVDFTHDGGPYEVQNWDREKLIKPTGHTGTVTLNADVDTFEATDVGRLFALRHDQTKITWGWGIISAYTDERTVSLDLKQDFSDDAADLAEKEWRWKLGAWSSTLGYPSAIAFDSGRLWMASTATYPQTLWASRPAAFDQWEPLDRDGSVFDDHAITLTIADDQVNVVRWLSSGGRGLVCGTAGGEFIISGGQGVVSPSNANVRRQSTSGSHPTARAARFDDEVLFIQSDGKEVRAFTYVFSSDSFQTAPLTLYSDHLTTHGLEGLALQRKPTRTVWTYDVNGKLYGCTYEPQQNILGWHRHTLGGQLHGEASRVEYTGDGSTTEFDVTYAFEADADLLVVVCTAGQAGVMQDLGSHYTITRKDPPSNDSVTFTTAPASGAKIVITLQGGEQPVVESLASVLSDHVPVSAHTGDASTTAFSVTYPFLVEEYLQVLVDGTEQTLTTDYTVSGAGGEAGGTVTFTVAPSSGAAIRILHRRVRNPSDEVWLIANRTIEGTQKRYIEVFEQIFDDTTLVEDGFFVDSGLTYKGASTSTLSGLDHLEGEVVAILGDGATHPNRAVCNGQVALDRSVTTAQVGLPYTSEIAPVPIEFPVDSAATVGRRKRVQSMSISFQQTAPGVEVGPDEEGFEVIPFRDSTAAMDKPLPLFTGVKTAPFHGEYGESVVIRLRQQQPLPLFVRAIAVSMDVTGRS